MGVHDCTCRVEPARYAYGVQVQTQIIIGENSFLRPLKVHLEKMLKIRALLKVRGAA